jgi:hypothetical protein
MPPAWERDVAGRVISGDGVYSIFGIRYGFRIATYASWSVKCSTRDDWEGH